MHDRGEQIEMACGRTIRICVASRCSNRISKLQIIKRSRIDKPAIARRIRIYPNDASIRFAQVRTG